MWESVLHSTGHQQKKNKRTRAWTLRGKTHFLSCRTLCPAQVTPNVRLINMSDIAFSKEMRIAIRRGDVDRISSLINTHPEYTNLMTPFGTWLHVASRVGNLDVVKHLVDLGIDVNKAGGTFETGPLKTAVSFGHIKVVEYLLSNGAKEDLSEPFRNPLFSAIYNGRYDIAELLVDHGIDTTVRYTGENMRNMDALKYAIELEQFEIADLLSKQRNALK